MCFLVCLLLADVTDCVLNKSVNEELWAQIDNRNKMPYNEN